MRWPATTSGFSNASAKIQAGLMICVYCLSYAPALLSLNDSEDYDASTTRRLLLFFVIVVQLNDALQYVWEQAAGQAPDRAGDQPQQDLGRLFGGVGSATLVGMALCWATPFEPWQRPR